MICQKFLTKVSEIFETLLSKSGQDKNKWPRFYPFFTWCAQPRRSGSWNRLKNSFAPKQDILKKVLEGHFCALLSGYFQDQKSSVLKTVCYQSALIILFFRAKVLILKLELRTLVPLEKKAKNISKQAEAVFNRISGTSNKTYPRLISMLQGFQKCIAWNLSK